MKRIAHKPRGLSTFAKRPRLITAGTLIVLGLIFTASCGAPIFAPEESGNNEAAITAAVEATVEVAVKETVAAIEATGKAAGEITDVAASDDEDASTAESTGNEAGPVGATGNEAASDEATAVEATGNDTSTVDDETTQLMHWLSANTRHYIGDPYAPVVFIEFSDFQ